MNKLILKNIGYDFLKENIDYINDLTPFERLGLIYILPNYTNLKDTRNQLSENLEGIYSENIMTFDDLVDRFSDKTKKYIKREESSWIIKKIIESKQDINFSKSLGTSKEIIDFIFEVKSNKINPSNFKEITVDEGQDIINISKIYEEYESFLEKYNLEDEVGKYIYSEVKNNNRIKKVIINGFIDFRMTEMNLIKDLVENNISVEIQYPFVMERQNLKTSKTVNDLKNLGFEIVNSNENKPINLAYNLFSHDDKIFNNKITLIESTNKYYEVREVFRLIREYLNSVDIDDISIIIRDEYEQLIRNLSEEYEIPLNIMNEEKIKDIGIVSSVINFLELIKDQELNNLISYLLDDNFNFDYIKNINVILEGLRNLDYKGLDKSYESNEEPVINYLKNTGNLIKEYYNNPFEILEEYLSKENLSNKILELFNVHNDNYVLSSNLKGLEIIQKNVEDIKSLSKIINLNPDDILEILIMSLKKETYYLNDNTKGIKVLKDINSIGTYSKYRFLLGMNSDFPKVKNKNLRSKRYKNLYEKIGIHFESEYEKFDNSLVIFSQLVGMSNLNIFSYENSETQLNENYSILLRDLINRVESENIKFIDANSMVSNNAKFSKGIDRFIYDINNGTENIDYYSEGKIEYINNILKSYHTRSENNELYIGKIPSYRDSINSKYSPKMLEFYNDCPFKFYIYYVLRYEFLELNYQDEFYLEKGNFYHLVLENFFKRYKSTNMDNEKEEIESTLNLAINKTIDKLNIKNINPILFNIYKNYLFEYVKIDIDNQKLQNYKYKPLKFEEYLSVNVDNIEIKGRVDRIDIDIDGNGIIFDYKSKTAPSITNVKNFEKLQISLYGLMYGRDKIHGLNYSALEESKIIKTLSLSKKETEKDFEEHFDNVELLVKQIDEKIKNGDFQVNPINDNVCKYCDFKNICRKEEIY